jgi:uncharacterized low-complexity protein
MTARLKCQDGISQSGHFQVSILKEIFMNKQQLLTIALGSALAAVASLPAHAAGNPFAAKTLDAGYQVAQADMKGDMKADMKAKEASCGADKKMDKAMDKKKDGSCGADKKADMKIDSKAKDGKCGEAKCGADKKK